jgi:hypothetical protein
MMTKLSRLMLDALIKRGMLNAREIQKLANEVEETLKPKNILTEKELREAVRRLRALKLPQPKSWAEACWVGGLKKDAECFSAERVYGAIDLHNLKTTLHAAGVRNRKIFEKLEAAAQLAEEYGFQ